MKAILWNTRTAKIGWIAFALTVALYLGWRWRSSILEATGLELELAEANKASSVRVAGELPKLERDSNGLEFLRVPETVVRSMKLVAETAKHTNDAGQLRLTGQLMLDPSRLVHVNTRFAGEVMSIENSLTGPNETPRSLRVGDRVRKGQLLAVLWSKEIGEKKSDLVDAISQLMQHEATYKSMKSVEKSGGLPQRTIDEMRRNVEADVIQVERLRRTLRSWQIEEAELLQIESEANRVHTQSMTQPGLTREQSKDDPKIEHGWAEVDIRSPMDGEILEINLAVGDMMTSSDDLFKIADLSRLIVMANAYEEDLVTLKQIPVKERSWVIKFVSRPDAPESLGEIMTIGSVIAPNQHTAIVQGWIDNSQGDLQVGQFIEALVAKPKVSGLVEFSNNAIVDAGEKKFVFVVLESDLTSVRRREVRLKRRTAAKAYVAMDGEFGIMPDERVLTRGLLELSDVWTQQNQPAAQQ